MQSRKIEDVNMSGDLGSITQQVMAKQAEKNQGVILNKDLLPSRGKFYPDEIRVKKMTTVDIKNLSMINQDTVNNVINSVIARNVTGVNINDVFVGDKLWLIFYLRSITYNDHPFAVKYNCDSCHHGYVHEFRMKDIAVNYIKDDFDEHFTTSDGDILTLTFPTIGNENQAARLKKDDQFAEFDSELVDIANYIKAVNDKPLTLRNAYDYLINMDPQDFATFANVMGDNAFGVKPTFDIECNCGNIVSEKLVFTPDFFMPDFSKK